MNSDNIPENKNTTTENHNTNDELYQHHSFIADAGQAPLRVDRFLMNFMEDTSRNKIQQAAKDGYIFVNNHSVKANYKIKPNDHVKICLPHPTYEQLLVGEDIPLDIVYEDDSLLVVNKPSGMVVHPGHGNYSGTLINGLIYHIKDLPKNSSDRPGLVHRIDKDTTGLLVVAKTAQAMVKLSEQFAQKTSTREYIALVWGNIEQDKGSINAPIGRHPKNRLQQAVLDPEEFPQAKNAVTHYKVLKRLGYVTLISCKLETGRTHQIRVHLKHIGHPLFNDERYGGDQIIKGTVFTKYKQFVNNCFDVLPRQALHAKTLGFIHPTTNEYLEFDSEIPQDIKNCVEKWKQYSQHNL